MLAQADLLLAEAEGAALEEMAGRLYEEASRKAVGDFPLSERIRGYWDRSGVEIDLVAVCESDRRIRFGTCKRSPEKLLGSAAKLKQDAAAFMKHHQQFAGWQVEFCAIAPKIPPALADDLHADGVIPQPISDLLQPLL